VHDPDLHGAEPRRIEALVPLDGARVLEVGCGDGRLTAFAAARAASVYAFDPDAERVAAARTALSDGEAHKVEFCVHGAEALDVERETFDVALCGWSL
jgi:ubiquinone/menaquinone biosynthesis C-methylase UbiE